MDVAVVTVGVQFEIVGVPEGVVQCVGRLRVSGVRVGGGVQVVDALVEHATGVLHVLGRVQSG